MIDLTEPNYLAITVAAVAAFVASGAWYAAFGGLLARLSDAYANAGPSAAATVPVELVRSFVVATVLAAVSAGIGVESWADAVLLALVVWAGFPLMILSGSVFHEKVPWRLAAVHAGDWLVKLAVIALIVGLWRG